MFHPQGPTFWELAEQCLSSTERGYDLLAPKFDYTPFRTPDILLDGMAKVLGEPQSIDAALDLCTGTGAAIRILRPLVRAAEPAGNALRGDPERHGGRSLQRVVGIDFSPGMLEVARQSFPNEPNQPPVDFVLGDVLEMDFREEFDVATIAGAQGHILPKDEPRFLERIRAALKPGGRFVFLTTTMPPVWSPRWVLSRGFNAAMHVRNAIKRPSFIMFYLTFLLPDCLKLLDEQGFDAQVHEDVFADRWRPIQVVEATRRP
ncbi:MAG TPA: class I SAM-dependent methyltransferase [Pirellulaceae bacterium]|nr:class I SAM-dependent methyltransferase [Pirellulaceae bacterium]